MSSKKQKNLLKNIKPNQIILPIIIAFSIFSYVMFVGYEPTIENTEESSDVQGISTEKIVLPVLFNSEVLSQNSGTNTENITLQTPNSPEEVIEFYDTALNKKGWEIDSQGETGTFLTKRYKKDKDSISISTSRQLAEQSENITIVTIEVMDN
jgi:hypothetical protein